MFKIQCSFKEKGKQDTKSENSYRFNSSLSVRPGRSGLSIGPSFVCIITPG